MISKKEISNYLESLAPRLLQENYDNSGWQCGQPNDECKGVLVCLDVTEKVLDEAIKKSCNLIVAHHPLIFKGIKKIIGEGMTERIIIKAIKNNISIYAIHTNLDNVKNGVNAKIGEKLGLENAKILLPKNNLLQKLVVFSPMKEAEKVRETMFHAGAGKIGEYENCSFNLEGDGTFLGGENSNPFVGEKGKLHHEKEVRIEVIVPTYLTQQVVVAMKEAHPYEEVAFDIYSLVNTHTNIGSGMIGNLKKEQSENDFLAFVKKQMQTKLIRHTDLLNKPILKVAVCGGSGRFLLDEAMRQKADVFITGDFKYHDFFDADGKILVLDIGHFESEQFTIELLSDWIKKKFNTFAVQITETNTNPVNYY